MKEARSYRVSGRVQGVGYRAFARRWAAECGVSGWARNLADETVEIHAEGRPEALERFARKLAEGPAFASVAGVHQTQAAVLQCEGFTVR